MFFPTPNHQPPNAPRRSGSEFGVLNSGFGFLAPTPQCLAPIKTLVLPPLILFSRPSFHGVEARAERRRERAAVRALPVVAVVRGNARVRLQKLRGDQKGEPAPARAHTRGGGSRTVALCAHCTTRCGETLVTRKPKRCGCQKGARVARKITSVNFICDCLFQ